MIVRLAVTLTASVFITIIIVRGLSVEDYGIYTLLYSLISYVSVIASFGLPATLQRFIPEALQQKNYQQLRQLVIRAMLICIFFTSITIALAFVFNGPIGRLLRVEGWIKYFSVFGWGIIIYLEAALMTSVLHSLFLHKYSVIANTLYTIFRGICVFAFLQLGWTIQGVLWAEVTAWSLWLLLLLFFYYMKFVRLHPGMAEEKLPLRRYFRYGGLSSISELGGAIAGVATDFFVITAFLGPGAIAFYAFADRIVKMITNNLPHIFLIDVIRPSFFTKYAQSGDKKHLDDMFNLLVKLGAFSIFPLVGGIFLLGDKMITIVFKPEYLPAENFLWIIVVSTALTVYSTPTWLVLQATEQIQITLYSKIFAIYNLVAEIFVIRRFGVMGVLLVSFSAIIMRDLFCYYFAKKYTGISLDWRGLFTITINSTFMSLTLLILRPLANDIYTLIIVALVGISVYFLAAWLNKAFTSQEREWINKITPKPIFVF